MFFIGQASCSRYNSLYVSSNWRHICQNYGAFFDLSGAGITGPVKLNGLSNGSSIDLSSQQWTYQVSVSFTLLSILFDIWIKTLTLHNLQTEKMEYKNWI